MFADDGCPGWGEMPLDGEMPVSLTPPARLVLALVSLEMTAPPPPLPLMALVSVRFARAREVRLRRRTVLEVVVLFRVDIVLVEVLGDAVTPLSVRLGVMDEATPVSVVLGVAATAELSVRLVLVFVS